MKTKLLDITEVIRSKNAGPYELTFDMMFRDYETFEKVCRAKIFNNELVCSLFGIETSDIINIIEFTPAKAIKITIKRPICSGDLGETDVYGAQQHAPLLSLEFDLQGAANIASEVKNANNSDKCAHRRGGAALYQGKPRAAGGRT